mgnify:CR=1 FL=1
MIIQTVRKMMMMMMTAGQLIYLNLEFFFHFPSKQHAIHTHTHTPSALPKLRREKNISIFSKRISIFGMLKNINFNNKDSDNDFFFTRKKNERHDENFHI